MWPATAWDDADWEGVHARGWTVMGRLRERQRAHRSDAEEARRRLAKSEGLVFLMTPALMQQMHEDSIKARWHGGPTVLAFLFAHHDSDAMRMLDARGDYFDVRTGDTWDLFFPGYYRSREGQAFELQTGAAPIGRRFTGDWYFNAREFDMLRAHIERSSEGRWQYSGATDLVLVNGWLAESGAPTIDWESTISGQVTDDASGARTLTLGNIVEQITRDLQTATEDAAYGVHEVTGGPKSSEDRIERDLMVNALGGIAAALGARALGL